MVNPSRFQFAYAFNDWAIPSSAPNTYTFTSPQILQINNPYGPGQFFSFNTNAPVLINDLATPANSERTTPTAVSSLGFTPGTLVNSHFNFAVQSGTAGLQEALNQAQGGSASHPALVMLDALWWAAANAMPGTTGAAIIAAAAGSGAKTIVDTTTEPWTFYTWSGTGYGSSTLGGATPLTTNGAVPIGASANYLITKAGIYAGTLAAQTVNGVVITITSNTAFAHTITATGLYVTGSAAVNLATFAAFAGGYFTVQSFGGKWYVQASQGVTFS